MTDHYRQALEGLRERCAQEAERITARRRAVAAMTNNEAVKPCVVAAAIRKIDVQQYYECAVREIERRLDREESDHARTIDQRDAAEDALGRMFQAVTGRTAEWSSAWGYVDAIEEVEEHVATLATERDQLAAALEAAREYVAEADRRVGEQFNKAQRSEAYALEKAAETLTLTKELEAAREDAERWRALRELDGGEIYALLGDCDGIHPEQADAAIDRARGKGER